MFYLESFCLSVNCFIWATIHQQLLKVGSAVLSPLFSPNGIRPTHHNTIESPINYSARKLTTATSLLPGDRVSDRVGDKKRDNPKTLINKGSEVVTTFFDPN